MTRKERNTISGCMTEAAIKLNFLKKTIFEDEMERRYKYLPKENIPSMKLQDFADNTNWKKLPNLKTI